MQTRAASTLSLLLAAAINACGGKTVRITAENRRVTRSACYHAYCEALGMSSPRCQQCVVRVGAADTRLATTLEADLPIVYTTLDRADLMSSSADRFVEAGRELGRQIDEACGAELAGPLDSTMQAVAATVPDLVEVASEARTVAAAPWWAGHRVHEK